MKLKNLLWLLVAVWMGSVFAACGGEDEPAPSATSEFKIATEAITALKSGGEYTITVNSTEQPTFTSSESWAKVSNVKSQGSKNQIWVATVDVEANSQNDDRVATVSVVAGSNKGSVTITQIAADGLYISSSEIPETVSENGGKYTVVYLSNNDANITSSSSWVSVSTTGGRTSMTEKTIVVTVEANKSAERQATVTIVAGDKSEVLTINQAGYTSEGPDKTGMEKSAIEIAKSIVAGWNIGNTLEAIGSNGPSETAWGNPKITEKLIKSIKAAGFNAVRLPVAWDGYIEDRATYKISDSWLDRVSEVVGWCVSNDMYVIVNIHWDGGWLENNCTEDKKADNLKEQTALWTQIATKLGGYDEHLLFAGCNEPAVENAAQMSVLAEYEQAFVDAVRATSGKNYYRTLIIQGPTTDIDKTESLFGSMPTDVVSDRLMAEVHYYAPWQFCGMESDQSWGKCFYYWGEGNHVSGSDRNATWGEEDYMIAEFAKMQKQFVSKGIPVILGEYGAIVDHSSSLGTDAEKKAHQQSRYDFNMKATREAKNHGLVPFIWDTNEGMDRTSGEITSDVIIPAAIAGAAAGSYPF